MKSRLRPGSVEEREGFIPVARSEDAEAEPNFIMVEEEKGLFSGEDLEQQPLKEGDEVSLIDTLSEDDAEKAVRRCKCCCQVLGFLVRAGFVLVIFILALFTFVLVVQTTWKTYQDGSRSYNRTRHNAQRDPFTSSFPFCAMRNRNRYGFIRNFCWVPKEDTDEIQAAAFLISKSLLDQADWSIGKRKRLFLIDAIFDRGSAWDGTQLSMKNMPATATDFNVFRFDPSPDKMAIDFRKEPSYFRARDQEMAEAISQSVGWSGWIASMEIFKAEDDEIWLDATGLIKSLFYIVQLPSANSPGSFFDVIRVTDAKIYPLNANIGIQVSSRSVHDRSSPPKTWSLTFSLTLLSERPTVAREMHEGIGYFTSSFRVMSTSAAVRSYIDETTVRIINRRKRFTYYVDPSVPTRWRKAVKKGVELWNKAFESFNSDIRLRAVLPTDDDWPVDYSAADVRYSTISWSVSVDRVFAMGPSTVDPRSGEILNSDIVISHGWIRSWFDDVDVFFDDDAIAMEGFDKGKRLRTGPCFLSSFQARGLLPANLTDSAFVEMVEAGLADVVSHEVGHTLGLRHNFKGSTQVPFDKLSDRKYLERHGLTASVMDYLPINPFHTDSMYAFPLRIGSYDVRAIQYGYEDVVAEKYLALADGVTVELSSSERLKTIAANAGPFATDEDDIGADDGADPEASAFDISDDPLRYCEYVVQEVGKRRQTVFRDHEPLRVDLAQRMLTGQLVYSAKLASKYIGGRKVRNRGRRFEGISIESPHGSVQRRALQLVMRIISAEDAPFPNQPWVRSTGYCVSGAPQQACFGVQEVHFQNHSAVARQKVLTALLASSRLERLAAFGTDLTLKEVFNVIVSGIFADFSQEHLWPVQITFLNIVKNLIVSGNHTHAVLLQARRAVKQVQDLIKLAETRGRQKEEALYQILACSELIIPLMAGQLVNKP